MSNEEVAGSTVSRDGIEDWKDVASDGGGMEVDDEELA